MCCRALKTISYKQPPNSSAATRPFLCVYATSVVNKDSQSINAAKVHEHWRTLVKLSLRLWKTRLRASRVRSDGTRASRGCVWDAACSRRLGGLLTRWVSWCTTVFTVRHLGTSPTISSHPPTPLLGFVCVPQTDTSSSYLAVDSTHIRPSGVFDCWSDGLELAA